MKTKTILILFSILIIIIGGQYFLYKSRNADKDQEILDLQEEKKTELKMVRDSAFFKIEELTINSQITFDSILEISQEIKYIPYEKLIYADRNLDDALDIISDYKYNKTAKEPD